MNNSVFLKGLRGKVYLVALGNTYKSYPWTMILAPS